MGAGMLAWLKQANRQFWVYLVLTAFFIWSLLWRLGSAAKGFSPADKAAIVSSQNHHALFSSFINDPHNVFLYGLSHFNVHDLFFLRLISVAFAAFCIWCFYEICLGWFGRLVAALATLMFATTPLLLLSARAVEPAIMYLWLVPIVYFYLRIVRTPTPNRWLLPILAGMSALAFYTPGYIWVLLFMLLFGRRKLRQTLGQLPRAQIVLAVFIFAALLVPLGWSMATNTHQLRTWLWLGPHLSQPVADLKRLGWSASSLVWRSSMHHPLQINRLALMNIAQLVLAAFGLYGLWQRARDKAIGFSGLILIAVIGAAAASDYNVLLIAIFPLMVLAAAGLRFLWLEWSSVFPRNPLPRGLALILICVLTASSVAYGLRYSLIGWPHTVATRQTYVLK